MLPCLVPCLFAFGIRCENAHYREMPVSNVHACRRRDTVNLHPELCSVSQIMLTLAHFCISAVGAAHREQLIP